MLRHGEKTGTQNTIRHYNFVLRIQRSKQMPACTTPPARAADWLAPGFLLIVSVAMAAWLGLRPVADQPALAWFSPRVSADRAVVAAASAGALIIDRGRLPTSLVLQPDPIDGIARLHDAGAWLVVNAEFFGGCRGRRPTGDQS
jgi:hypothetical protein